MISTDAKTETCNEVDLVLVIMASGILFVFFLVVPTIRAGLATTPNRVRQGQRTANAEVLPQRPSPSNATEVDLSPRTSYRDAEACTQEGPRCSPDCRKIEICEKIGDWLGVHATVTCSGTTPYCDVETLACSRTCNHGTGNYETTTVTTTTYVPEKCTEAGTRCSEDCRKIEICEKNGTQFGVSAVIPCPEKTPFCDINTFSCSLTCDNRTSVTTAMPTETTTYIHDTCTATGPRCSRDCTKIEICELENNHLFLSGVIDCHGKTPFCNIDTISCSVECNRRKNNITSITASSQTVTSTISTTREKQACQKVGYRCSSDCMRLELCTENSNELVLSVLETCSGNTPFCNIDYVGCSTICKITNEVTSNTQSTTPITSTTSQYTTKLSTTEIYKPCQKVGYRCSSDCMRLELCTENNNELVLSVLQTCSGNTPFCNIDNIGCSTICKITNEVTPNTQTTTPVTTTISQLTTTLSTTEIYEPCQKVGYRCSSDCMRLELCTENNNELVLSVLQTCSRNTPFCNIDYVGCSTICKITNEVTSNTKTTIPITSSQTTTTASTTEIYEPCQKVGYRCSSDCMRLELCTENNNELVLSVLQTCSGNTPFCNIDYVGCSTICKITNEVTSNTQSTTTITSTTSQSTTKLSTTEIYKPCQKVGYRCSSDCMRLELCTENNNELVLSVLQTCSGNTPFCNIDNIGCSTICKITNEVTPNIQTTTPVTTTISQLTTTLSTTEIYEPCQKVGYRCSSDCMRLELCTENNNELVLSVLQTCSGNTPFCNIDYVGCSTICKITNEVTSNTKTTIPITSSQTTTTASTTEIYEPCQKVGYRCSSDCMRLEICTENNNELVLSVLETCSGNTPFCNIDYVGCSTICKITNEVTSNTQSTTTITSTTSQSTTKLSTTEIYKPCQKVGYRCSSDCMRLELCTENNNDLVLSVLQTCSGNTPFCNIDNIGCSTICKITNEVTPNTQTTTPVTTTISQLTTTLSTTEIYEPCQKVGYRCSSDCMRLELCTENNNELVLSVLQTCSGNTPFCNIDYVGCSTICKITNEVTSNTKTTIPITSSQTTTTASTTEIYEPCQKVGYRCSSDCMRLELCTENNNELVLSVLQTCNGNTPFCNIDLVGCSTICKITNEVTSNTKTTIPITSSQTTTTASTTEIYEPCQKVGYRCSSDCMRLELCTENNNELVLSVLETCSGNTPFCNIDYVGCSTICKITNEVTSNTQSTTTITSTTSQSTTKLSTTEIYKPCQKVGYRCSSDCMRLELCTENNNELVLSVLQTCSGNTPFCNIDNIGCSTICKITNEVTPNTQTTTPVTTTISQLTTTLSTTEIYEPCQKVGYRCSSDCMRLELCTENNNELVLSVLQTCSGNTPFCNIDNVGCSTICKITNEVTSNTKTTIRITSSQTTTTASTTEIYEPCQKVGYRCSSDCMRLELCTENNNELVLSVLQTCSGNTPFCNIDLVGCSTICKITNEVTSNTKTTIPITSSQTTTVSTTETLEPCQKVGYRCSSDCMRLELCTENNNESVLSVLETCSGNTPFCNIDNVGCSAICKITNEVRSNTQITASATPTTLKSTTTLSTTEMFETCTKVGYRCSSDCSRIEQCTEENNEFILTVLDTCSGKTPFCNINYFGCSTICIPADDVSSSTKNTGSFVLSSKTFFFTSNSNVFTNISIVSSTRNFSTIFISPTLAAATSHTPTTGVVSSVTHSGTHTAQSTFVSNEVYPSTTKINYPHTTMISSNPQTDLPDTSVLSSTMDNTVLANGSISSDPQTTVSDSTSDTSTTLITVPFEPCRKLGYRCSSDCSRFEFCIRYGDTHVVPIVIDTCGGDTPYCNIDYGCSAQCKISDDNHHHGLES